MSTESVHDRPARRLADLLRPVQPLRTNDTVAEAAKRISSDGGGLPVVDDEGKLVGYLGERVLLGAICPSYLRELHDTEFFTRDLSTMSRWVEKAAHTSVADHMVTEPVFLHAEDSETHAAELFLHHGVRTLPVVSDDGKVLGIVRLGELIGDLMKAVTTPG